MNLYANGEAIDEAQLTAETGWTYTWEALAAKDDDDIQIEYSVSEVELEGYVSSIGDPIETETGIKIAITNTLNESPEIPTTNLSVIKKWNVPEGMKLPESILVNVYANGEAIDEAKLTAENNWMFTWEGLPKFDGDNEIVYAVKEEPVDSYQTSVSNPVATDTGMEITITNTFVPVNVDLPQTGDDSSMALWIAMLSMAGAAMLMLRKRAQN